MSDKVYLPVTGLYDNDGDPINAGNPLPVTQAAQPLPEGAATAAKQDDLLEELQKKADLTETQPVSAASLPLPAGAATSDNQTNGTQKTLLVDLDGHIVNVQRIDVPTAGDEYGAMVISMIHGKSTAGGGTWVDVKVSPAGAVQIDGDVRIYNGANVAEVVAGAFTGVKGLRVYGGPTDPVSDIPVGIDFGHHQRHEGETHRAEYFDQSLDTNTVKFAITVPVYANTIYAPHLLILSEVYNGSILVRIYEGATFTGGLDLPSKNANRNSANTPGMTIKSGVTSTDGTLLPFSHFVGAGTRESGSRATDEILLKSNTVYRVDLIGLTAGTDAIVHFEWYEDLGV